ncbi:C-terminal binding protein [Cyanobium sp. ATX 6A2]|uniref:C-terminal binding protein n=1 Tax=Cyanobium sp. ATX 6A2 TaxID=2823700 RepID=UPI0020CC44F8|nr:C-terminal binding protein [Cyanobium sp. ATX 6A2]MCP9889246.1 C-terminal binding protein [Cyanobium sp. ATX 6A2]
MSVIAITDHFEVPSAEEKLILGNLVGTQVGADTEVLMVWHAIINQEYISKLPNLRGVQRYGVGYENLDLDLLRSRRIPCCNNPDYGVDEVADTAIAMILNITRGVSLYNCLAKQLKTTWQENVLRGLRRTSETLVGVIGSGRIGSSVLLKCRQLGFNTCFYDPYLPRGYEKVVRADRLNTLKDLLACSDIVSIHTPLTPETAGMINESFVANMKRGASLVNTARGRLVADLDILLEAISSNQINHVALDVIPDEPPTDNQFISTWRDLSNPLSYRITINPHTAYFSEESYIEIRSKAAQNALRIYNRESPFNLL